MTKMNFSNNSAPALSAENLNQMQTNIENAIDERLPKSGGDVSGQLGCGGLEVKGQTPYIDMHFNNSSSDFTSRIIEEASGKVKIISDNGFELTCNPLNFKINNQPLEMAWVKNGNTANYLVLTWQMTQLALSVDNTPLGYVVLSNSSDERLKTDIKEIDENVIKAVSEIKLKQFILKRNNPENKISFGIIAQELIEAFEKYGLDYKDYSLINTIVYEDGIEYFIVDYEQFSILRLANLEKRRRKKCQLIHQI